MRCEGSCGHPERHISLRKLQCLQGVSDGLTNKEIGARIGLTAGTVKVYITSARACLVRHGELPWSPTRVQTAYYCLAHKEAFDARINALTAHRIQFHADAQTREGSTQT